ncbi:MAG TPA: type II secretion system F family protein [Hyphomicrobiales bacterium]|nr:type II secretion system F family protein [Hyphomicrobiales bacterium]
MALYTYKAMSRDGFIRTGTLDAANEADLEKRLLNMHLDLIRADTNRETALTTRRQHVPKRDLIVFCMQMAQLIRAGVPMLEALSDLRDSMENPSFKEVIGSLIETIESGRSLSQALQDFPAIFDTLFVNLVRAGEASGRLAEVFESLTATVKWQDELQQSTRKLLMTPLIVGTVVLGVTLFLMVYLVPQLLGFIRNMGGELPLHTRALVATSNFVAAYWYLVIGLPLLGWFVLKLLVRTNPQARHRIDALKLRVPRIGPVLQKIILSRFANFFSMMYAAGIPILNSLEIAENITDNVVIRKALAKAREDIEQGEPISQSLASTGMFPPLVLRMLKIGETTGKLDEALASVTYFYDRDIKDSIDNLQALLQPVMTIIVGTLLGWVMLSVLGPVYSSLSTMPL